MKYGLITCMVLTAAAAVNGVVNYQACCPPELRRAARTDDAMAWLRTDFKLTDAQYTKIVALHRAYGDVCAEHCRAIQETQTQLDAAKKQSAHDPVKVAAAENQLRELQSRCENSIEIHVREVAACMDPAEGARYLALILPRINGYDHGGTPDLDLHRR